MSSARTNLDDVKRLHKVASLADDDQVRTACFGTWRLRQARTTLRHRFPVRYSPRYCGIRDLDDDVGIETSPEPPFKLQRFKVRLSNNFKVKNPTASFWVKTETSALVRR